MTNSQIDPLQRLTDAFGTASVRQLLSDEANASRKAQYQGRNHQIYPAAGSIGWGR